MVGFMVLAQRKVLLLAADDFEDMELLYPLYRLAEEDVEVTVAGLDDHPVRGKKGHGPVPVDTTVGQVAEGDFDALVIPGGYAPDKLRRSETVLGLVRAFDDAKKPIAFICHAGWVPISAKILKGRRATSVGAIRDDMVNAGHRLGGRGHRGRRQPHLGPDAGRPRPLDESPAEGAGLRQAEPSPFVAHVRWATAGGRRVILQTDAFSPMRWLRSCCE